jgi:hypothetical protein
MKRGEPRSSGGQRMGRVMVREWLSRIDNDPTQRWAVLSHHARRPSVLSRTSVGSAAPRVDCFEPWVDPRTVSTGVHGFRVRFRHSSGILSPEGLRVNRWR